MVSKKIREQDPFFEREAAKYPNPVPSREFILSYLEELGHPIGAKKLLESFEIEVPEEVDAFHFRLKAMLRDGQLMKDRRRRYCLLDKIELIPGTIIAHPDGYGFVETEHAGGDIYLSPRQMRQVMHGDRVLVRSTGKDHRGRAEGTIHEVLERNTQQVVGRYHRDHGVGYVVPDNKRLTQVFQIVTDDADEIKETKKTKETKETKETKDTKESKREKPSETLLDIKDGQIVLIDIVQYPSVRANPVGRVVQIIGDHMAPGMEIDVALHAHDIPHHWPLAVNEDISRLEAYTMSPEELKGRADLRDLPLVTIDGEDAKDFDDAVHAIPNGKGGWRLIVAIADVSHYVAIDDALDKEAQNRGNSVYFPGRVVPMLPEVLSNNLCSLKPKVDRLCMVCDMSISAQGKVTRYRFYSAVMHSKARLTYTEVAAMLVDNDPTLREKYAALVPHLEALHQLYLVLLKERQKRGAIEFDTTETEIVFNEQKKIERITPVVRNVAHRIIEECMLSANVCTAKFLEKNKIPSLYRNHESPSVDKLTDLRSFLGELGLSLGGGKKPKAIDYSELLAKISEREDAHLIQTVMLRSLQQARYAPENIGHFGLAYKAYAHFTSPIRRYPDLLVHRAIRHVLAKQEVKLFHYSAGRIAQLGEHCSVTERRADEATRDVNDWLKCEYMQDHVGEEFPGIISAVTSFGLFVELKGIYVEGLVHVTNLLNDYYQYDSVKHRLIGERTSKIYRLSDPLRVRVARVDLDERKIDFELA